jgi:hypothetical protein
VWVNNSMLMRGFVPGRFHGDVLLFSATQVSDEIRRCLNAGSWKPYVDGVVVNHDIDAEHEDLLTNQVHIAEIGRVLAGMLATDAPVESKHQGAKR